jgi:hypothetical protein
MVKKDYTTLEGSNSYEGNNVVKYPTKTIPIVVSITMLLTRILFGYLAYGMNGIFHGFDLLTYSLLPCDTALIVPLLLIAF